MLNESECKKIISLKAKIAQMLKERNANAFTTPSKLWQGGCERFRYLFDLPEQHFDLLRLHTHYVDGEVYHEFLNRDTKNLLEDAWKNLAKQVDKKYLLSAPQCLGEFGYHFDGHFVNNGILRFQQVMNTLVSNGVISYLQGKKTRKYILEIGGGYGGLAYHLCKILDDVTFIIIDLPETLLFSGAYLSLAQSKQSVYIYDEVFQERLNNQFKDCGYALLPNYVTDSLNNMKFDIVINTVSFQEMNAEQLDKYLDLISGTLTGVLYSLNEDSVPHNPQSVNITEALSKRFIIKEITNHHRLQYRPTLKQFLNKIAGLGRFRQTELPKSPVREYICTSHTSAFKL